MPESWLPIAPDSAFSLANIPFGIISTKENPTRRPAIAIGDFALDLQLFADHGGFAGAKDVDDNRAVFAAPTLNGFAESGRSFHRRVREYLRSLFLKDTPLPETLRDNAALRSKALLPLGEVENHLPLAIGDYTDFYAGLNHAYNVGAMFRGPNNALQPNYKYLPVAYHGRASSVVVSGTPIRRPQGQILRNPRAETKIPVVAPCEKLDYELELGMFICKENRMGMPIAVDSADEHIFGYVLVNDWSARDIQAWEYIPLGPFTSKNFGTSISPWVVLADALHDCKGKGLPNDKEIPSYLRESTEKNVLQLELEIDLISPTGATKTVSKTNSSNLLWSWPQMIAHHTVTGCNLSVGDMFGSGTISGPDPGSEGSLLEQSAGGKLVQLDDNEHRTFLEDGDTVVIRGWAVTSEGAKIGLGEVRGTILPSWSV